MGVIAVIILFFLLIIGHELGHFLTARRSKVKVKEFGIGIPPKAKTLTKDKKGTVFTLNRIPLGGFVRLKGENPNSDDFLDKDSFTTTPFRNKVLILLGGIIANLLIAYAIFFVLFSIGTKPLIIIPDHATHIPTQSYVMPNTSWAIEKGILEIDIVTGDAFVEDIIAGGRAESINIEKGSTITKINNTRINNQTLKQELQKNIEKKITITRLDGQNQTKQGTVECNQDCLLGVIITDESKYKINHIKKDPFTSMKLAGKELLQQSRLSFIMLGDLTRKLVSRNQTERTEAINSVSGPVGAAKIGSSIRNQGGWKVFLLFAAMISLALAVFNVLPIPALDGGRLLSVIIQYILKISPRNYFKAESYINLIFFVALMLLGIYIIVKDLQFFRGIHIF